MHKYIANTQLTGSLHLVCCRSRSDHRLPAVLDQTMTSGQRLDHALPTEWSEGDRARATIAVTRLDCEFQPLQGRNAAMDQDTMKVLHVVAIRLIVVSV